jgi:hypothetical protein
MTVDKVQEKDKAKKDINWRILVQQSEREIKQLQARISRLRKSLTFFNEQADSGVTFPIKEIARHRDLS